MVGQIVEIVNPGHSLKKSRGFLKVSKERKEIASIPLDDIACVMVSTLGCNISTVLIDHLCGRNIPIVICGANYAPSCLIFPIDGFGRQFQIMRAQSSLSEPRRKQAWKQVVKAKLLNQSQVLEQVGSESEQIKNLIKRVRSGDKDNCEAQAARLYWRRLFGAKFRRDRSAEGINSSINYAYTVVRATIVRGICAAGLHPTFSIHHKNPQNPFNLADDLIEPFRPIVDYVVWQHSNQFSEKLGTTLKQKLASILNLNIPLVTSKDCVEYTPMSLAAVRVCKSFASYCEGNNKNLLLPSLPSYLEVQAL